MRCCCGHARRPWHAVRPIVLGVCMLLLAACTPSHRQHARPATPATSQSHVATGTSRGVLGQPGCDPPSPIDQWHGLPEVEGTSDQIRMWGLIMVQGARYQVHVNEDVKIVWRITGSGGLQLVTLDPNGRTHPLQWGPDPHGGSTYTRAGEEWGAGYRFTQPGCWTLRAIRGTASASVWLQIAA
jgi:hypothetical protein